MALEEEISVSYNHDDKLDLNLTAGISYNSVDYTLSENQSQSYFVHNYAVDATYDFGNEFLLSTILDINRFSGSAVDAGQQFAIWNASLSKPIGKNNRCKLTFSVNNLLNQQNNIERNVYENVIETVQNIVQKRFAMLTFTYNLNNFFRKKTAGN
jgi:outer membrane receptor for Fe3+-dicitrate